MWKKITCWPKKSSQGCLCIEAIVRNHFLRLSERFCFVLFLFENARFPLRSLISVKKITHVDRTNLHRDVFILRQRRENISLGFEKRAFCFLHDWKMVYQQLKNVHFPLRSLISVKKKITHVDRRNLHRNVFVLRQRWEIISFQNEFFVLFVFEKWFISNLKMHIRKNRLKKIKMACNLIR